MMRLKSLKKMNKLIFLGTGNAANLERQMTSLLFMVGNKGFLIDCGDGMGTVRNIIKAGVNLTSINDVILTHPHADHILGLPHFIFVKLVSEPDVIINIYGPQSTLDTARKLYGMVHSLKSEQIRFFPSQSKETFTVLNKVKITGLAVPHLSLCFAYAVEIGHRKIVFTGDMAPSLNFDKLARNCDILIHECHGLANKLGHLKEHSTAKDAGITAQKTKTKHLILSHLHMKKDIGDGIDLITEARKYFSGKITLAQDLLQIPLSAT